MGKPFLGIPTYHCSTPAASTRVQPIVVAAVNWFFLFPSFFCEVLFNFVVCAVSARSICSLSSFFFFGKHVVYGYGHVRFHQGWIQNKIIVGLNKLGESSAPISYESIQIIFSGGLGGSPWSQWQ